MASNARLGLAIDAGMSLPETGRIAVFAPRSGADLSALPKERCHILTGFKPDRDYFAGLGWTCNVQPEGRYSAAVVFVPRAKAQARALVAMAADVTDGLIVVDGQKTDGIESVLKECRKRAEVSAPLSKAHGKTFAMQASDAFRDWLPGEPQEIAGGFVTAPGVFSADGIDPASEMLVAHLPEKLGAHVVDLGAGWGYLSAHLLKRDGVNTVDLVEADHAALRCARLNVGDARARFHWDDATRWRPDAPVDCVVMNPPFHTERAADPALGRAFIASAAAMLKPSGHLWMVANRHLPYEPALEERFDRVEEVAGTSRFKIFHASRPKRARR